VLNSLYARLLAWLIVPLLFLSAALLVYAYLDSKESSEQIFDKLLVTLALSISEHALASGGDVLTDDLLELIRVTTNDNLYYKVIGPDSAFITGYEDIPEPPGGIQVLESHLQFYDAVYLEQAVRIIAVSSLVDRQDYNGWMTTFVAQTLHERQQFLRSALLDDSLRVFGLIAVAAILLSIGVALGLRPLKQLQSSVQRRSTHDLSAIRSDNLPLEIRGLAGSLNDLLQRLGASMSLNKRFVENAAHQLRTPVTALLPQTELALRHAESERERIAVTKIKHSAEGIARLTHQLLNLTYAESIALAEKELPVIDLADIVTQHLAIFAERHAALPITRDLQPAPVAGMELLLGEALDNLLNNAQRYGDDNNALGVRTGICDSRAFLEVTDQGRGIPQEQRARVIERFFRLDNKPSGSGLGLAIVKEIIDVHGGELSIGDGRNGTGTCVRCTFRAIL